MIRGFLFDFLFPLIIFLVLRSVFQSFLAGLRGNAVRRRQYGPPPPPPPDPSSSGRIAELRPDPVCGAYVPATSYSRSVKGKIVYFCSAECRDKFVA